MSPLSLPFLIHVYLSLYVFICFQRLPDQIKERNEKMKEEMLGMYDMAVGRNRAVW